MSRPYPTTFEKEQSPMTPISASASNTPISYKANVNRQKTKKWADAKPASYGGDDWGDDDEYDLPPPPPISKPTGFRQPGQAVQGASKPEPPIVETKNNYGDLPPLPRADDITPRARVNSFDAGDEKRNFSSDIQRQPSPAASATAPAPTHAPATRFSQITGQPSTRDASGPPALSITTQLPTPAPAAVTVLRKPNAVSPSPGSAHPDILLPGRTKSTESSSVVPPIPSAARTPSIDFQTRRDYSPSAVPPPLQTRGSPAPQGPGSPAPRFSARKSSLSQTSGPDISEFTQQPQELHGSTSHVAELSSPPASTPKSPATQGKALPFIRPADIYKRAEEERKTRESLESERPSVDSVIGARGEGSQSPVPRPLREKSSSDSLGGRRRTSTDVDDMSDSGRLRPVLEPVRERKSEYGFEGFNANDDAPSAVGSQGEAKLTERQALEVEEERRQSASPKLPDLTRISGFGMDIFTKPKPEEPNTATPKTVDTNPTMDNPPLQKQDSTGFKSVVHQAFDREGDSSVPDTPASRTNSEIRRTDSESTGTTGISPIMSRVPSAALHDSRNRDGQQPSILEAVTESDTPPAVLSPPLEEHPTPTQSTFKPGHRRDISTPSPNNSPARTPDLAKPAVVTGHEAIISDPSPASSTGGDESQLQPPRPIVGREESFRPNLPGGWSSYDTTNRSESSQGDSHPAPEAQNIQHPVVESLSTPLYGDDDPSDITPTTSRHPLPATASVTALSGSAPQNTIEDESDSESENEWDNSPVRSPQIQNTGEPQHHNVPALALDPRNMPKLEQAPAETQLRPDTIHRDISAESSEPPLPPEKDTPEDTSHQTSDYFPKPMIPLLEKSLDRGEHAENPESPTRPQMVPTVSMDSQPEDEENEKLRQEIIQSLSPKPSEPAPGDENLLSDQLDDELSSNQARISSYLPSEYDNYWATTTEEEQSAPVVTAPEISEPEPSSQSQPPASIIVSSPTHAEPEVSSGPPPSTNGGQTLGETRPSIHPQRFSWERSSEDVSTLTRQNEPVVQMIGQHDAGNLPQEQHKTIPETPDSDIMQSTLQSPLGSHLTTAPDHAQRDAALIAGGASLASAAAYTHGSQPQGQSGRRLSLAEEKDPHVSSYPVSPSPPVDQHPAMNAETRLSPNTDHPADHYAPSGISAPSASSLHSVPPSSVSPVNSPIQPQFAPQPSKLLPFREIAAMKNSNERIQNFDQTRHEFATMDYGLTNWISSMMALEPEHADASPSFRASRASFPVGSARGKGSKVPAGNLAPLQQPYYQQYLNASSPTSPGTTASKLGPSIPAGSQHGLSSAGNKITTQQVQAKGKELLHTAGIFGGKAGKAGKGLLAKGKSKLRAAGGSGDKTTSTNDTATTTAATSSPPPTPPSQSKSDRDRRSSWGLPLTLARSSASIDGPNPMPRQRAATLTLDTSRSPGNADGGSPMTARTDDSYAVMSAPGILDNLGMVRGVLPAAGEGGEQTGQQQRISQQHISQQYTPPQNTQTNIPAPASETQAQSRDLAPQYDGSDTLAPPAPIGKDQPSWDPSNATPIVEEEDFQWEERHGQERGLPQSDGVAPTTSKGLVVPVQNKAASERSQNGENVYQHTREVPETSAQASGLARTSGSEVGNDLGDWVMVPEDVEPLAGQGVNGEVENGKVEPRIEPPVQTPVESQPAPQIRTPLSVVVQSEAPKPKTPEIPPPTMADFRTGSYDLGSTTSIMSNTNLGVSNRPRGNTSNSILDRPRYSYDVPRATENSPPSVQQKSPRSQYQPPAAPASFQNPKPQYVEPQPRYQPPPVITSFQNPTPQYMAEEPQTSTSFKGLPPIRRTSTFGLGFGSRQSRQRFSIEDEEEETPRVPQIPQQFESQGSTDPVGFRESPANPDAYWQAHRSQNSAASSHIPPPVPPFDEPQSMGHAGSLDQSQRPAGPYNAPRATDPSADDIMRSQEAWRPGLTTPTTLAPSLSSPGKWSEATVSPQRPSPEQQRNRSFSNDSEVLYNERMGRTVLNQQGRPYETPPSSAQRYPELFRPGQTAPDEARDAGDLPSHYYQAPITREAAFLPRQQTNEYQLPGVGPPTDEPGPGSQRNSGIFRELGNKIRSASRERGNSLSYDGGMQFPGQYEKEQNEYAESSAPSEDTQGHQKRRNSFFGRKHAFTTGMAPLSRESTVAHPASRIDFLSSAQASPITSLHERKRSFFSNSNSSSPASKPDKLARASTSGLGDGLGKKKRFSGLTTMFGRTAPSPRASPLLQATREVPQLERQPVDSPNPNQQQFGMQSPPLGAQEQQPKPPTQQRSFINKFSPDPSQPRSESSRSRGSTGLLASWKANDASRLREEPKPRTGTGLSDASQPRSGHKSRSSTGFLSAFTGNDSSQPQQETKPRSNHLGAFTSITTNDPSQPRPGNKPRSSTGLLSAFSGGENSQSQQENKPRSSTGLLRAFTGNESSQSQQESKTRSRRLGAFTSVHTNSDPSQHRSEQENKPRSNTGILSAFSSSHTNTDPSQSHQESKTRKMSQSTSALLGGIMGRRSNQQEKREDSSSNGTRSQGSQQQYHHNQVPSAQTYSDIQQNPAPTQQSAQPARQGQTLRQIVGQQQQRQVQPLPAQQAQRDPWSDSKRGRGMDREPRYDSVPIPGGYSLVRGDGAVPMATEYDPRGLNRLQQNGSRSNQDAQGRQAAAPLGPSHINTQQQSVHNRTSPQTAIEHRSLKNSPPNLAPLETDNFQRSSRRISREDVLARSPARAPQGQQPPYQLSLPGDIEDRAPPLDKDPPVISPPASFRSSSTLQSPPAKVSQSQLPTSPTIQRLAQPVIRHPQSPAGYPLPDDTVFSPINPSANNLPPPPPPKWPQHLDNTDHHHLNITSDLNRSNTLLSGISQVSHLSSSRLAPLDALDEETGARQGITPSPTPPSPGFTPPPGPQSRNHNSLTMNITASSANRRKSPDLYNASPQLPKTANDLSLGQGNGGMDEMEKARKVAIAQEEKIFYDKDRLGTGEDVDEEVGPAAMSATSYPGQEWNPYAGVYEDDF